MRRGGVGRKEVEEEGEGLRGVTGTQGSPDKGLWDDRSGGGRTDTHATKPPGFGGPRADEC